MSARAASGDAVTGTGPSVLTVSSRTEPDTGHPPATGTLTPDDANPPLRAHRERRRTAGVSAYGATAREIRIHGSGAALIPEGWQVAGDGGQTAWITDAGAIAFSGQPLYPGEATEAGPLWPSGNFAAVEDMGSCSPPFMAEIARPSASGTSPLKPEKFNAQDPRERSLATGPSPPAPRSPTTKPSPRPSADSAWPTCAPATWPPTRRAT